MEMKRACIAWVLVLAAALAVPTRAEAAGVRAVRRQAESAMRVTGTISTDPQGLVTGYALDQADKLPKGVRTLVDGAIAHWRFSPRIVAGQPVASSTDMSVLVLARPVGEGNYQVEIASMAFGLREQAPDESVRVRDMPPPDFPDELARVGAAGTVYLLVRVGRDGKVADAAVEQVNLRVVADDHQMDRMRRQFAHAALRAPPKWTFLPPTRGQGAQDAGWTVRVPVAFQLQGTRAQEYGRWDTYIRGPRSAAPWEGDDLAQGAGFAPDALPEGGVYLLGAGSGPRLLSMQDGQP
jgi:TonB family protein